ncbi:hypothetical protein M8818_007650 [Zalaria obscura]|uniref:Uncharacterized protein n=1 Tax=Zalaria obscura TaxID=2024903 RepID=A0ACC3S2X4_9PEZI
MDHSRLETLQASQVGRFRRLLLGLHRNDPSGRLQLARADDLSLLPRRGRVHIGFRHGVFISGAAMANAYGGALAPAHVCDCACSLVLLAGLVGDDELSKRKGKADRDTVRRTQSEAGYWTYHWSEVERGRAGSQGSQELHSRAHVFRLQRLLRLTPTLCPNDHLRDGKLHPNPVERSKCTTVPPLLLHHPHPRLPVRPIPDAWAILRRCSTRRRHRFHPTSDDEVGGFAIRGRVSEHQHIRQRGAYAVLDGESARHGEQAGRWHVHPGHYRTVRSATRHERLPG